MKTQLNSAIGNRELCAWQIAPNSTLIQTREPKYADKLRRRSDGVIVARGVSGGYLRIFHFKHPLSWARQLIERYTYNLPDTNEP